MRIPEFNEMNKVQNSGPFNSRLFSYFRIKHCYTFYGDTNLFLSRFNTFLISMFSMGSRFAKHNTFIC